MKNTTTGYKAHIEIVKPIKDSRVLQQVQETLLMSPKVGRRNYTIFQVGKVTLLRVSDVLNLKLTDVFESDGSIKHNAYIVDRKTGKRNTLYLRPLEEILHEYWQWLEEKKIYSRWLFPSIRDVSNPITEKAFYKVMVKVGDMLNINYLGTHTMRKTGAFRVYEQSEHNIGLVMSLLNHSREATTLAYLGLDQDMRERVLDHVDFG